MPENNKIKNAIGITGLVLSIIETVLVNFVTVVVAKACIFGFFDIDQTHKPDYITGAAWILIGVLVGAALLAGWILYLRKKRVATIVLLSLNVLISALLSLYLIAIGDWVGAVVLVLVPNVAVGVCGIIFAVRGLK